jgi:signal transduction histidine kinase
MVAAAKPYNLRILGPNCIGIIVPGIGLNGSFAHMNALPGKIAFISQSGGLTTGVLDYAGIDGAKRSRERRPVDLAAVADRAVADLTASGDLSNVAVELDVDHGGRPTPVVMGDPDALRRALQNLLANAVRHGGDGGWVGLAVRAEPPIAPREVVVEVRDRGRGIDPDDLDHVFEPFYRGRHAVEQQVRGNGLGLSLVKRIVETYGGRVTAASTPGEGAIFTVVLPVAPVPEPDDTEAGAGDTSGVAA